MYFYLVPESPVAYIEYDWLGLVVWSLRVKLNERRWTIKGRESVALTSLSGCDIHQWDPSLVKSSPLPCCQFSPAVSSWGSCQRAGGECPRLPTWLMISGIFKDCKNLQSCNFTSKRKKKNLPDNEHFALIRTVGLIRLKLLTDILMVNEAALKMPLDSLET